MAELSRPIDKEFNVEVEGGRFSTSFLNDLVDTHVNKIAPRYIKFQKLYEGKHKIQNRPRKDKNKPNNKLVNDFFGQTIDNTVGYFLGNPIVLNYTEPKKDKAPVEADPADVGVDLTELEDTAVQDELDKICSDNDKDDLFIEWGKEAMIKGLSHILVYQDEESHTKMMRVSPEDLIIVYKNSSTKEPAYKIRLYDIDTEDTKKTTHYAEVYSPKDNKDKLPSKMFSQSYKPLIEAFDKATPVIGDKAKKLFEDFAKECDIIYKKQQETFNAQHEKLKEQYRSGAIDWKKYNSLFKKLQKEVNEEADNKRRALFGGGVSGLQDIYDAVSKGTFRDTGQVTYGHESAYYTDRRRTNPNCSESLANYASLCVGHSELIDILAEDYPEIVTALRGCVEAMLKEVPK